MSIQQLEERKKADEEREKKVMKAIRNARFTNSADYQKVQVRTQLACPASAPHPLTFHAVALYRSCTKSMLAEFMVRCERVVKL